MIRIGKPIEIEDEELFFQRLAGLKEACNRNSGEIRSLVQGLVPTYRKAVSENAGKLA